MKRTSRLFTWQAAALLVVLGLTLSAAFAGALGSFAAHGFAMTFHGWLALTLGTFFTLALGVGLMFLVFYSARKGYDDAAAADPMAPDPDLPREHD